MSRIFKKIGGDLRSAMSADQINTPGAIVGVFLEGDDEQLMRLFYRAYELGRLDKAAEFRRALGIST